MAATRATRCWANKHQVRLSTPDGWRRAVMSKYPFLTSAWLEEHMRTPAHCPLTGQSKTLAEEAQNSQWSMGVNERVPGRAAGVAYSRKDHMPENCELVFGCANIRQGAIGTLRWHDHYRTFFRSVLASPEERAVEERSHVAAELDGRLKQVRPAVRQTAASHVSEDVRSGRLIPPAGAVPSPSGTHHGSKKAPADVRSEAEKQAWRAWKALQADALCEVYMRVLRDQGMRCAVSNSLLTVKGGWKPGKTTLMTQVSFDRLDNSKSHSAPGNTRAVCCIFQTANHYVMSPKRFAFMAAHNCFNDVQPTDEQLDAIRALLAAMPYEPVWEEYARAWEATQERRVLPPQKAC